MPAQPLKLVVPFKAQTRVDDTEAWLRHSPLGGDAVAARFMGILNRELSELCADVAERLATGNNLPRIDEEASLAFAVPAFRHTFTTLKGGKRKRRQTGSVWIIFYTLPGDGSLQMLTLRHGAAEPLTAFLNPPEDDATDEQ